MMRLADKYVKTAVTDILHKTKNINENKNILSTKIKGKKY